mmetsp:Transcript_29400/g.69402  ORF Transcript_29400/g.69402 Transcript_29400/m.69402 type:complete len:132 (+) Transcript_29400:199-594(+)
MVASPRRWREEAQIRVGLNKRVWIDGQLTYHGSLWTTKTEGDRHREHVRNCVRDSQAWRERQADNLDLDQVVEKMIEQFGESYTETDKWYVCGSISTAAAQRRCSACRKNMTSVGLVERAIFVSIATLMMF